MAVFDGLAAIEANANVNGFRRAAVVAPEFPLDAHRATDRGVGGDEEAVMPSPVCLTSALALCQTASHDRIMCPHEFGCHAVAEARCHLRRADDIGKDRSVAGIPFGEGLAGHLFGFMHPPMKCLDRGKGDLDDFAGDETVRFAVDALRGLGIRRIDQTERCSTPLIVPIGEELHPVPILERPDPCDAPSAMSSAVVPARSCRSMKIATSYVLRNPLGRGRTYAATVLPGPHIERTRPIRCWTRRPRPKARRRKADMAGVSGRDCKQVSQ